MHYLLLLRWAEMSAADVGDEQMKQGERAFQAYSQSLTDAGVLVSAEMLQPGASAHSVSMKDGQATVERGPHAGAREQIAGVFTLDVPDVDTAVEWAKKCPAAGWGTIEVRPSAKRVENGTWVAA